MNKSRLHYWLLLLGAYALAVVVAVSIAGCVGLMREDLPPDAQPEYDHLVDVAEQYEAEHPAEASWLAPLAGLLPYGLGGAALELVGVAASRRKRRLYGAAIKHLSSGQLADAAGAALQAWGVQHSSPQPPQPQA